MSADLAVAMITLLFTLLLGIHAKRDKDRDREVAEQGKEILKLRLAMAKYKERLKRALERVK